MINNDSDIIIIIVNMAHHHHHTPPPTHTKTNSDQGSMAFEAHDKIKHKSFHSFYCFLIIQAECWCME